MSDVWFHPDFDHAAFRNTVARYIKLLIRARWILDPRFISNESLKRWKLSNIDQEPKQSWQLLRQAADTLAVLNTEYIPRCGSGGIPVMEDGDDQPVIRLIEKIAFFVSVDGGGPYHNQALVEASVKLQQTRTFNWEVLAEWHQLDAIRDDLDRISDASPLQRRSQHPTSATVFPVSADVGWTGVTIEFVSNDSFRISAGTSKRILTYAEAGFKDGRRGNMTDSKWALLRMFAMHKGRIDWSNAGRFGNTNVKQAAISEIRRRLKSITGLEDDPFHNYRSKKAYETKFTIRDSSQ